MLPSQKIIAFDLDGTLAPSKSPIQKEVASLLKELIKKTTVIVISGGILEQFEKQLLAEFFDKEFLNDFSQNLVLMPTSGSQRYEYNKETKIWVLTDKEPFPEEVRKKAIDLFQLVIESPEYGIPSNPKGEIIEDRDTQITLSALGQKALLQDKVIWDPDRKKREKIKSFVEPKIPEATVRIGGITSVDILPKDFNKGVGITRFLNKINKTKEDVIFVGDALFPGGNDYSAVEAGFETISVTGPEETAEVIKKWIV